MNTSDPLALPNWGLAESVSWVRDRDVSRVAEILAVRLRWMEHSDELADGAAMEMVIRDQAVNSKLVEAITLKDATAAEALHSEKQLADGATIRSANEAGQELFLAAIANKVKARGVLDGGSRRKKIKGNDWADGRLVLRHGELRIGVDTVARAWKMLLFDTASVVAAFPQSTSRQEISKRPGRPKKTGNYPSDDAIVLRIISLCDDGKFSGKSRVTRAIKSMIPEIEPTNLGPEADAGKTRRLRERIKTERPDLLN